MEVDRKTLKPNAAPGTEFNVYGDAIKPLFEQVLDAMNQAEKE